MTNIGTVIYGYCNGYFGDDYDDKIIVFETKKAICCTYIDDKYNGILVTANFDTEEDKQQYINKWSIEEEY